MANHYIRDGASGDGSDWTNAWDDLPGTFVRGDTYYVADGSYGSHTFDTAVSGTDVITVKKATASDHGTETGWDSGYGDGQAQFSGTFAIRTSYITIDGVVGSGTSGHGFYIKPVSETGASQCINTTGAEEITDITLAHIELEQWGYSNEYSQDCLTCLQDLSHKCINLTVQNCWMHNVNRVHVYAYNLYNAVFEDCWFTERYSEDVYEVHGESFTIYGNLSDRASQGCVIRRSVFRNVEGTGIIVFQDSSGNIPGGWKIYNNLFYTDADHTSDGWTAGTEPDVSDFDTTNGSICDTGGAASYNHQIYNNTFVDLYGVTGIVFNAGSEDNTAINNLWVACESVSIANVETANNNTTDGATSLFDDYASHDYHLSAALEGAILDSEFATDLDGETHGADGTWDRGAYDFQAGLDSLPLDGSTYYWRIAVRDEAAAESGWSADGTDGNFFVMDATTSTVSTASTATTVTTTTIPTTSAPTTITTASTATTASTQSTTTTASTISTASTATTTSQTTGSTITSASTATSTTMVSTLSTTTTASTGSTTTTTAIGEVPPYGLYANDTASGAQTGRTNPEDLIDLTPALSAMVDPAAGRTITHVKIQVSTDQDFATITAWNSGWISVGTDGIAETTRTPDIQYGQT